MRMLESCFMLFQHQCPTRPRARYSRAHAPTHAPLLACPVAYLCPRLRHCARARARAQWSWRGGEPGVAIVKEDSPAALHRVLRREVRVEGGTLSQTS